MDQMSIIKKDNRLTKLQQNRRSWDFIIAAHYHYGAGKIAPQVGYRTIGKLFVMPPSTVRSLISRTPKNDPEVRHAAMRFGLIRVELSGLENGVTARQMGIDSLLSDIVK